MQLNCCCAQIASTLFDPVANLEKADRLVRRAADQGAELVLLPEYLTTGCVYDRRLHELAETLDGKSVAALRGISLDTECWIGCGIAERDGPRVFNTFVLVGPGGELHTYRKRHPAFFEKLYFKSGRSRGIVKTPFGRVGMMVCWDMIFPQLVREMRGKIDLLVIVSAWPKLTGGNIPLWGFQRWSDRQPAERPRKLARMLGVPVVYCNATGPWHTPVPGLPWSYRGALAGQSALIDAAGQPLASAGCEETLLSAELSICRRLPTPIAHVV